MKHTSETKARLSKIAKERGFGKWMLGKKLSKETIEKLKKIHKGRECKKETREKISKANSGNKNGMFGKTHTKEYKLRLSKIMKDKWKPENIRDKLLNYPEKQANSRKAFMKAFIKLKENGFQNTKPELKFKLLLEKNGISYEFQKPIYDIEHQFYADFYIPKINTIIEIDGVYWHKFPNLRPLDIIRNKEILNRGYGLIRLWGELDLEENYVKTIFTLNNLI